MRHVALLFLLLVCWSLAGQGKRQVDEWPDGTPVSSWFSDTARVDVNTLGRRYVITDYGVASDSTIVQTQRIQDVIDRAYLEQGGVIVVPRGTYLTGALFFRPGTHLLVEQGGRLKGSERISDYPVVETRIEGQTCKYFAALINADGLDGFVMAGPGTIDGNGYHYWQEFWIRRQWNPDCTNKDAQRPRLVYLSNCTNVTVQDLRLHNSPFWTNHLYRSSFVRYLYCHIFAPTQGVKAPSSDAIDIDVCHDVLVHGCYMNVNDDAIAIKGGKGTWADQMPDNGPNYNILIQHCHYGAVHGCLTLGSESLYNRNIILRDIQADRASRVLWLKLRPDTPQHYEFVRVERIRGRTKHFLVIRPWTQFYQAEDRPDMPPSQCNDIQVKDVDMRCDSFYDVAPSDKYTLCDFLIQDIRVTERYPSATPDFIEGAIIQ